MRGKIIKGIGGFYYVKTSDGSVIECKARGVFRKDNIKPYIGDDVEISVNAGKGTIEKISERRNMLIRPPVANIDILLVVVSTKDPGPDTVFIDKLLVSAEFAGIKPILCINKTDLSDGVELTQIYENAGYDVLPVSAKNNDGIEKILPLIKGKTSAVAGFSGVGKSTILSILTGEDKETGDISKKIKRGRHTTRCVELLELTAGGYVLDTPGFSSFEITGIRPEEIAECFPEMRNLGELCRFKGCSHIDEPDCAVKEKVFSGEISESRYESYKIFYKKTKEVKEWGKK